MGTALVRSTDAELVARTGAGDMEAYEELCRRYTDSATQVANTVANTAQEVTDIVFEAFARVLVRLREPNLPASELDSALRLVIRRIALDRHLRTQHWDEAAPRADEPAVDDPEHQLLRRAFDALPAEWQQALWHAEIEQKTDTTMARGLGTTTTEVAARVYRAREVVRQGYLAARLTSGIPVECQPSAQNMYAFVQRKLPRSIGIELAAHLEHCDGCRGSRDVLRQLVTDLRSALFTALLMPTREGLQSFVADAPGAVTLDRLVLPTVPSGDDGEREQPVRALPPGTLDATPVAARSAAVAAAAQVADAPEVAAETSPHPKRPRRATRRRMRVAVAGAGVAAAVVVGAYVLVGSPDDDAATPVAASTGVGGGGPAVVPPDGDAGLLTVLTEAAQGSPTPMAPPIDRTAQDSDRSDPSSPDDSPGTSPDPSPSETPAGESDPSPTPSPTQPQDDTTMPVIDAHPQSTAAQPGGSASFTVSVSGAPAPSIQWQQRAAGGSWGDISGATSATVSIDVPDASVDGAAYRAVVANTAGSVASEAAVLHVEFAPQITQQPADAQLQAGAQAYLEAAATANPGMSEVRWQVREPGGSGWHDVPASFPAGAASRLSLSDLPAEADGTQFRAVFTNAYGSATTNAATVSISGE